MRPTFVAATSERSDRQDQRVSCGTIDAALERWLGRGTTRLQAGRLMLALLVAYGFFAATYLAINSFSVGRNAHILYLPGESRLPFVPLFEYLYVLAYFLPLLIVRTIRNYPTFRRLLRASASALLVAYTTYLLFPVYLDRPLLTVNSCHTWLLSLEYLDRAYNHFPSLHVTWSWLAVFASQVARPAKAVLALVAFGVSVSTLFVKQHYVVDVIYGLLLAALAWRLAAARRA